MLEKCKYILIFFILSLPLGCSVSPEYRVLVKDMRGNILTLNDAQEVAMVGIAIPSVGTVNYKAEIHEGLRQVLIGKEVMLKTVLKKKSEGYPRIDLVEVFVSGKNMNEQFLENGQAFFVEDYWDKKRKNMYRNLASKAQINKIGIWKYEDLKVIYSRHKNWQYLHDPSCSKVQSLKPVDRIDYFIESPVLARGIMQDTTCEYCTKLWLNQMSEKERQEIKDLTKTGWEELRELK